MEGKESIYREFTHPKKTCPIKENDEAQRNNYHYHEELIDKWLETLSQSKHEINCQDCLNRLWNQMNGNLIYLETWESEEKGKIYLHKQVLAEIKALLDKITASGQFHNCGIKKCCDGHDRPEHPETENPLIIAGSPEKKLPKPKKSSFDRQSVLNWMKEKGIIEISRNPQNSDQFLIKYDNGRTENCSAANDFPAEWAQYLKKETSENPIYLGQPTNRNEQNRWPVGKIAVGALIIIGFSVIGILVYRWTKKK